MMTLKDLRLLCNCQSEGCCFLHGSASEQREAYEAAVRRLGPGKPQHVYLLEAGLG